MADDCPHSSCHPIRSPVHPSTRNSHYPCIRHKEDYAEHPYYGGPVSDSLEAAPRLLTTATDCHAQPSQQGGSDSEDEMAYIYYRRRAFGNKGNL